MPQHIKVRVLSSLSLNAVATRVSEFVRKHSFTCKYCTDEVLNLECVDYKNIKHLLQDIPESTKTEVYEKLLQLLSPKDDNYTMRYDFMYMITWLCEHPKLKITYKSSSDCEDIIFASIFAKYIHCIRYSRSERRRLCNNNCFNSVLHQTSKLQIIDFRFEVSITDNLMESIGKNCFIIKILHGNAGEKSFTPLGFQKLLFEDYNNLKKNRCCDTLEVIDIEFMYPYHYKLFYETDESRTATLNMIALNAKNLKKLGSEELNHHHFIDKIVSAVDFPTKIESGCVSNLTVELVTKMKTITPKLKHLTMELDQDIEALRLLKEWGNLETLEEPYNTPTHNAASLYEGILNTEWVNLKKLALRSDQEEHVTCNMEINLDEFSTKLTNLEHLTLYNILNVTWSGRSHFRTLKYLEFIFNQGQNVPNFNWFLSFSRTIMAIKMYSFSLRDNPPSASDLIADIFPELEVLHVTHIRYDEKLLDVVLNNCPKLCLMAFVHGCESDIVQLEKYPMENNLAFKFNAFT